MARASDEIVGLGMGDESMEEEVGANEIDMGSVEYIGGHRYRKKKKI